MTIDPRVADEIHDKTISVPVGYVYEKKNLGCHNFKNVIQFQVECSGIIRTFTSNKFITGMQLDVCQHSIFLY